MKLHLYFQKLIIFSFLDYPLCFLPLLYSNSFLNTLGLFAFSDCMGATSRHPLQNAHIDVQVYHLTLFIYYSTGRYIDNFYFSFSSSHDMLFCLYQYFQLKFLWHLYFNTFHIHIMTQQIKSLRDQRARKHLGKYTFAL